MVGALATKSGVSLRPFERLHGVEVVLMLYEVEFVVDDIKDIVWNPSSFGNLSIPAAKKKAITALAKAHMSRASDDVIDDFVEERGKV